MRSRVLVILLAAILCGGLAVPGPARANTDTGEEAVALVHATYDDLLALFYRPLSPRDLLQAGWAAISTAHVTGMPAPGPLGDVSDDQAGAFAAFEARFRRYLATTHTKHGPLLVADIVANGMVTGLHEQHTNFLSSTGFGDLGDWMPSRGVGLGIRTSKQAPWIVTDIANEGPAARSGLAVGDVIVAANGVALDGVSRAGVVAALSGERDSKTKLTLDHEGHRLELALTNAPYAFPAMVSRMLKGNVGYLRLEEFEDSKQTLRNGFRLIADFDRRLDELDLGGATALILDLRDNPGGSVATADALMGRFLPEDAPTVVRYDERGHQITGIVDGRMRTKQPPLVVLVNGDSASASETTVSTLREANRAVLVGQRTHGALATSSFLPLPGDAALQVAMAELVTSRLGYRIDQAGFPVDVEVPDDRTAADYRGGRDPQLEAALRAIADAPAPPVLQTTPSVTTPEQLHAVLAGYCPDPRSLDVGSQPVALSRGPASDFVHPNQLVVQGARDPLALQHIVRERGWLGRHEQEYDVNADEALGITVDVDVYATNEGAASALLANDLPDLQTSVESPLQLGDSAVAYVGAWMQLGATKLAWQRGTAVVSVQYYATPGHGRSDIPAAFARLIDQTFDRYPLRMDALQAAQAPQSAAPTQNPPASHAAAAAPAPVGQSQPSSDAGSPPSATRAASPVGPATLGILFLGLSAVGIMAHVRRRRTS